jgi:hypothetical protein
MAQETSTVRDQSLDDLFSRAEQTVPRQQRDVSVPRKSSGKLRAIDDFVRSLAHGATMGYSDEIAAGIGSLFSKDTYADRVAAERRRDASISPGLRVPGEIVGGVGSMIAAAPARVMGGVGMGTKALGGLRPSVAQRVTKQTGRPFGLWDASRTGGLVSAAYASGEEEGTVADRVAAAGWALPIGLTLGAGGHAVTKAAQVGIPKATGFVKDITRQYRTARKDPTRAPEAVAAFKADMGKSGYPGASEQWLRQPPSNVDPKLAAAIKSARDAAQLATGPRAAAYDALAQTAQRQAERQGVPGIERHISQRLRRQVTGQATLADVGGEEFLQEVVQQGRVAGRASDMLVRRLGQRSEGETKRVTQGIKDFLTDVDMLKASEGYVSQLQANANPIYIKAFAKHNAKNPVRMNRHLLQILSSRHGRAALKDFSQIVEDQQALGDLTEVQARRVTAQYRKLLRAETDWLAGQKKSGKRATRILSAETAGKVGAVQPTNLTPYQQKEYLRHLGSDGNLSLETWDAIKKSFDRLLFKGGPGGEIAATAYRTAEGGYTPVGRTVNALRIKLIKTLDKATGGKNSLYRQARAQYQGDSQVRDALYSGYRDMGGKGNRLTGMKGSSPIQPQEMRRRLASIRMQQPGDSSITEAYRIGGARVLMEKLGAAPDASSARKLIYGSPSDRARINLLFPSKHSRQAFKKLMDEEEMFERTFQRSPKFGTQEAQAPAETQRLAGNIGAVLGGAAPVGHQLVLAGIMRNLFRKGLPPLTKMDEEMVELLTRSPATGPDLTAGKFSQLRMMDEIRRRRLASAGRGPQTPTMRALRQIGRIVPPVSRVAVPQQAAGLLYE